MFESERDGNWEIYTMNPDGSAETRLTKNTVDDYTPVWSPDGKKILFASERNGNGEIYVMNTDGTGQKRLTNDPAWDYDAVWSPDGTKIAWETERHLASCPPTRDSWRCNEIYVMNADGSGQTRLTTNTAGDYEAHWSPDGSKIVFESERDGNFEIYVMNADGSGQTKLSNHQAADYDPIWSPDGNKIAFESERDGQQEIYVMNADGSVQTNLTNNSSPDYLADCCYPRQSWSPDGSKIAFATERHGPDEIYVMNADGSAQTRLTNNTVGDWDPIWSPDGTQIAFESNRDGDDDELYLMNPDGTGVTRLTSSAGGDYDMEWGSSPPTPETTITAKPKASTTDPTPTFRFESSMSGSTFQCKLDSGSFKPCTSPKTYGKLKPGKHTFSVRAVAAGAKDPTPAKATWKIKP